MNAAASLYFAHFPIPSRAFRLAWAAPSQLSKLTSSIQTVTSPTSTHKKQHQQKSKTYNTRYSLVVTDPTTDPALIGLSMGERTGSRVFQWDEGIVILKSPDTNTKRMQSQPALVRIIEVDWNTTHRDPYVLRWFCFPLAVLEYSVKNHGLAMTAASARMGFRHTENRH
ncbi:hypothetical protein BDP55DRAFT_625708 [Colletotrichum godetiae]|uniref:Uncharacterized protein n=1 Tax=Colletotrichum godetiae TaxID=1209918 RepID=A0AAJ0B0A7_9PEZI|nr:uncharacterized protein BDP55DRAFT_625708 [Colletotrichum godetiae]KAK1701495.1 hypothetical protein BDP55DRAFT_625708 [Colletotrichum godetiae]